MTGDASIGTDTLRSIEGVQGTNFNDTYDATTLRHRGLPLNVGNNGTFNQFEGLGGNDTITGNGNTRIIYSSASGRGDHQLAAGTATGDASVGTDSYHRRQQRHRLGIRRHLQRRRFRRRRRRQQQRQLQPVRRSRAATTPSPATATPASPIRQAAAAVTVDLSLGTAHGTAGGDVANVGTDTITGGVNSVQGSNFNDSLTGGGGNELFFGGNGNDTISAGGGNDQITGQAGNDTIDGGAGTDMAIYTGAPSRLHHHNPRPDGQIQVADSDSARDGTDILTNVEVLQFTDVIILLTAGTAASPVDISAIGPRRQWRRAPSERPATTTLLVGGNSLRSSDRSRRRQRHRHAGADRRLPPSTSPMSRMSSAAPAMTSSA